MRRANPLAVAASPKPHPKAALALRQAMLGLFIRSRSHIAQTLASLDNHAATTDHRAATLFTLGLAARGVGDWPQAAHCLLESAEAFLPHGDTDAAALAFGLTLETLCTHGNTPEAKRLLTVWASEKLTRLVIARFGSAMLKYSRGEYDEALELLRSTPAPVDSGGLFALWRSLVEADILLEKAQFLDAAPIIERLLVMQETQHTFSEAYLRARALSARLACETLGQALTQPTSEELESATRAVHLAWKCTQNSPRYAAWTLQAWAQLEFLKGHTSQASAKLQQAFSFLEASSASLDLGKGLSRQAYFLHQQSQKSERHLQSRARDILIRLEADGWSKRYENATQGAPAFGGSFSLSKSIAQMRLGDENDVELKAVFEVNRAISSLLELEPLLQKILSEVVRVFKAERGALFEAHDGQWMCRAAWGLDASMAHESNKEISFSALREAARENKIILSDNAQLDGRFQHQASVMAKNIRSVMCAPLNGTHGHVGFLYLDSSLAQRVFKPQHQEWLEVFATQAATAIENAQAFAKIEDFRHQLEAKVQQRTKELDETNRALAQNLEELKNTQLRVLALQKEAMEKEMLLAKNLQEQLLPPRHSHQLPGFRIVGQVEAATQVGGDFWTWVPLSAHQTLVFVGDVTGHGVAAGMLTTVTRAVIDTLTHHVKTFDVSQVMSTLSEVLHASSRSRMTMTAVALLVDAQHRHFQWVNAGHAHPLYSKFSGGLPQLSVLRQQALNPSLGLAPGQTYISETLPFEKGDRLFLYTDGLLECVNASSKPYGIRRLQKAFVSSAQAPLETQMAQMVADSQTFLGTIPHDDDITFLLTEFL